MFIDSHCHLDFSEYDGRVPEILTNMKDANVSHALCVSVDMPDFYKVLELATRHENLYASVGVHPDYENTPEPTVDWLIKNSAHPKVIAIGETGLDYFRLNGRSVDEMEWQRNRFRTHIRAAIEVDKPLIIHTRSSAIDTLKIMEEEGASRVGGVMHCFTESLEVAKRAIDLGFYISFSGIVTFKNAIELHKTCSEVPLERMLIETDSPYLAPVPYRGKTNQPAWVRYVAEFISNLKSIPVDEVGNVTSKNFKDLFKV